MKLLKLAACSGQSGSLQETGFDGEDPPKTLPFWHHSLPIAADVLPFYALFPLQSRQVSPIRAMSMKGTVAVMESIDMTETI
jgi:hypothetical protein